jgi:methionyl-tRNA formyltransferase
MRAIRLSPSFSNYLERSPVESDTLTLPSLPDNFAVILFGLECVTTRIVLDVLVTAGINVKVVCLPGRSSIPLLKTTQRRVLQMASTPHPTGTPTVSAIARSSRIEVWRVGDLDAAAVQTALSAVDADLLIVACYNRLIPATIYSERRYGGVNIHPSLLPDKRGPDPLFWVFRDDTREVGTTIHRLTQRFDAGEILGQSSTQKSDGIGENELDAQLAKLGSRLLMRVIRGLTAGNMTPVAQKEQCATYAPHPELDDYHLTPALSARHAFNFVRGIEERGHPITLEIEGQRRGVQHVHRWTVGTECPVDIVEGSIPIRFSDGWLVVTLADSVP